MTTFRLFLVACALAVVLGTPAHASLMRALGLAELTASAETIVVGAVLSTQSAWDAQHRTIHSTVEIAVEESWKGSVPASGRMVLRHWGGTVGDIEMTVHGEVRFEPGERVVVFAAGGRLVGMGQGKRHVAWDPGARRWMAAARELAGASLVGPAGSEGEKALPLDALRTQVRALLAKGHP